MPWEGMPRASDIDMESSVLCKDDVITVGLHVFSLTFDLVTVVPTAIPTMISQIGERFPARKLGITVSVSGGR